MSLGKRNTTMPDAARRRASTNRKTDGIMRLARRLPLTGQVLADQLGTATPAQMEFVDRWMNAEIESREASKRTRLPGQAGFPAARELDDYDRENVRMPADRQRSGLESLGFLDGPEDVAVFGPAGAGRTHLAIALGRKACRQGVPVRFHTAAGLVMRPLRANTEGKLDRELQAIAKARMIVIDELGYVPIDEEGSRLLFQVVTNAYETQSIVYTTNIESGGWGRVFGDPNMAAAIIDRTVHHGRMIRFEGESYRRTHALMQ
ncbi:IS21-like element helper ATPase IstB [Bifidobacterium longum]|uniref:IS21-like element helper ATPase IstB n=1 Tax=Bifidobacterium longum TaxID=216816 RepID=UPI00080B86BF